VESQPIAPIHKVSAAPQDGVSVPQSGLVLEPVTSLPISGGVVPCQDAAEIRIAIAVNRSLMLLVTTTLASAPAAIRYAIPTLPVVYE